MLRIYLVTPFRTVHETDKSNLVMGRALGWQVGGPAASLSMYATSEEGLSLYPGTRADTQI